MSRIDSAYGRSVKPRRAFAQETSSRVDPQKDERESWRTPFVSPEKYVNAKLRMLRNDMYIEPTAEEIARLRSKKTEVEIDSVVRGIVARAWA